MRSMENTSFVKNVDYACLECQGLKEKKKNQRYSLMLQNPFRPFLCQYFPSRRFSRRFMTFFKTFLFKTFLMKFLDVFKSFFFKLFFSRRFKTFQVVF